MENHEYAIETKAAIILAHFHESLWLPNKMDGHARAMLVTDGVDRAIIPSPHESQLIFLYDTRYLPNLGAPQSTAALHPDRVQPELGDSIVTFNVHVWKFIPVSNVEEEAKRSMSQ